MVVESDRTEMNEGPRLSWGIHLPDGKERVVEYLRTGVSSALARPIFVGVPMTQRGAVVYYVHGGWQRWKGMKFPG